eukprot:2425566-Rhodomonas_salina.1
MRGCDMGSGKGGSAFIQLNIVSARFGAPAMQSPLHSAFVVRVHPHVHFRPFATYGEGSAGNGDSECAASGVLVFYKDNTHVVAAV